MPVNVHALMPVALMSTTGVTVTTTSTTTVPGTSTTTTTGATTTTTSTTTTTTTTTLPASSCTGGLIFAWHAEDTDTSNAPDCNILHDSTYTAAATNSELSSTDKSDGTTSVHNTATGGHYTISVNQNQPTTGGTIEFDVRIASYVNSAFILELIYDANNTIAIYMGPGVSGVGYTDIRANHKGNGSQDLIDSNCDWYYADNSWARVKYEWKENELGNDHKISIYSLSGTTPRTVTGQIGITVTEDDDLVALTTAPTALEIGVASASAAEVYVDNIKVYNTSSL